MRILHTADWHLGQKLYDKERFDEFQNFLDWLIELISEKHVDLLIVAGDIFDVANPPQKAIEQYYQFLAKLVKQTDCQHAVIVGGNHDSIQSLNAPKELAKLLQLHIIGGASEKSENDLVEIQDNQGNLQAVVAAVPFLRDKDIRYNQIASDSNTRDKMIVEAISKHYAAMATLLEQKGYTQLNIPLITTGHLFAQGCSHYNAESQENGEENQSEKAIYTGNLGKVPAHIFPKIFDYVALGHLHRSQIVGGKEHIRYSGSPLPLSFSERNDEKSVLLIDFEGKKLQNIQKIAVPSTIYRKLIRIAGNLEEVCEKIKNFPIQSNSSFPTSWAEIRVVLPSPNPNAKTQLEKVLQENTRLEALFYRIDVCNTYQSTSLSQQFANKDLQELDPLEIFRFVCRQVGCSEEDIDENLLPLFLEIKESVENQVQ
ncbi:MAG: exonuclease SbcCD subunit D C-terminal domain-containing protein [Raineya sp.]|nr:exonuclease SbcCD subunit D C-terminal domain-containing protein [Raineya sp.]